MSREGSARNPREKPAQRQGARDVLCLHPFLGAPDTGTGAPEVTRHVIKAVTLRARATRNRENLIKSIVQPDLPTPVSSPSRHRT